MDMHNSEYRDHDYRCERIEFQTVATCRILNCYVSSKITYPHTLNIHD